MKKIVIDTNVLVSSIISRSYPYFVIGAILLDRNTEWCVSDEIVREYKVVLRRKKFLKYPDFAIHAESLLFSIDTNAANYYPEIKLNILVDPDDDKFLELAATCNADFLITGNTTDFTMSSFGQTKIVTPKDYWEKYR